MAALFEVVGWHGPERVNVPPDSFSDYVLGRWRDLDAVRIRMIAEAAHLEATLPPADRTRVFRERFLNAIAPVKVSLWEMEKSVKTAKKAKALTNLEQALWNMLQADLRAVLAAAQPAFDELSGTSEGTGA